MRRVHLWSTLCAAVLLPLLAVLAVQAVQEPEPAGMGVIVLREARVLVSDAATPPAGLASAPLRRLPLSRQAGESSALWLAFTLPPATDRPESLALAYKPGLSAYLDGVALAAGPGDSAGTQEHFVLGHQRWVLELLPGLHRQYPAQVLQLRLAAPGPSGAGLEAPLLGPPEAVQALDAGRRHWQLLRAATALGGALVAAFLALVARTRRDEPVYALSALHVALLALLLSPYVLPDQPLPSPWWRMLLDAADLGAKLLLVAICARLAHAGSPWLRRLLWGVTLVGLPLDLLAAALGWPWGRFDTPWPWWALGSRALLFLLAWSLALRALRERGTAATWGTALLVGFSASTWAWVSLSVLVLDRPVIDANALAHAGWVAWVALLLLRHFNDGARRERQLRERLAKELEQRRRELEAVFAAHAQVERERAASEQRRRLLQDLHDGLGARLLSVRLRAPPAGRHGAGRGTGRLPAGDAPVRRHAGARRRGPRRAAGQLAPAHRTRAAQRRLRDGLARGPCAAAALSARRRRAGAGARPAGADQQRAASRRRPAPHRRHRSERPGCDGLAGGRRPRHAGGRSPGPGPAQRHAACRAPGRCGQLAFAGTAVVGGGGCRHSRGLAAAAQLIRPSRRACASAWVLECACSLR